MSGNTFLFELGEAILRMNSEPRDEKKKKANYLLNTSIVTCYADLYLYTTMTEAAF